MYGANDQAAACHQLGARTIISLEHSAQTFDATAYLTSVKEETKLPCPETTLATNLFNSLTDTYTGDSTTSGNSITTDNPAAMTTGKLNALGQTNVWQDLATNNWTTTTTREIIPVETNNEVPVCVFAGSNLTVASPGFKEMMENITEYIRVESQNTSMSRRKKVSAQDNRVSSVSVGVLGCCLLSVSLGMIVLTDLGRLVMFRGGAKM
ncbi:hypothetical protein EGW08_005863 [Elysia chlorotica]|uniref:Uncharacterized protein n=1 Tax=Elysia chlorotica TaxID=188477 RepID=A0A3S0ZUS7_ELYCH|nr:hypothetical protein EGW08_005863 [Elysia chlorotica]